MRVPAAILLLLAATLLLAPWLAPLGFAEQDREHTLAPPGARHWLGTDHLGRDNFARLLYGGRLSLTLGALAAAASCALAAALGMAAALGGPVGRSLASAFFDIMLSTPWYLLVFCLRALLPIDATALTTASVTFAVLGLAGWAHGARTVHDAVWRIRGQAWITQARASGAGGYSLLRFHILPNVFPLVRTNFLLNLPNLLLAEATLGMLGLGIPEPLPSWGGSLTDLTGPAVLAGRPWTAAPAFLLAVVSICLRSLAAPAETEDRRGIRKELATV